MNHLASRVQTAVAAILLCCVANAQANEAKSVKVDIHQQSVLGALKELGEQTGLQLLMRVDSVSADDVVVQPVSGQLSVKAALDKLLAGTGLTYEFVNDRTIRISRPASQPTSSLIEQGSQPFRLATIADVAPADRGGGGRAESTTSGGSRDQKEPVEQVVVTAQKREERLQDVPVPVTALNASTLSDGNQVRLEDYYSSVPGLSLNTTGAGDATLALRGVTTGAFTNSTVAVAVDDIPVGTASALTNNNAFIPDLDPSDLTRVEVLRGPQGTLYGASSIGGLVKYVTVDPSTDKFSGRLQSDINGVKNGDSVGYGVRGAVNVPLNDSFAIRASGFYRDEPGYIDDPVYDVNGVNQERSRGGWLSGLWKPSDAFSVKLGALVQDSSSQGLSVALQHPGFGDLDQTYLPTSRGAGAHISRVQVYSANVVAKAGDIDLASSSSYSVNKASNRNDFTPYYGGFGSAGGALYTSDTHTNKFTQEIRASSTLGERIEWLLGAFYTHESSPVNSLAEEADPVTGETLSPLINFNYTIDLTEYAGFADLTLHFTDRFDVQFGGRQSSNRQTYNETDTGVLVPAFYPGQSSPLAAPTVRTEDNSFTYLVTPRFVVSPDLMLYARLASGYRPGGPNAAALLLNLPEHVQPDKTRNYELGAKGSLFGRMLSYDTSAYYIDWKNVQLLLIDPVSFFGYFTNASGARSKGLELSLQLRPFDGLSITAWGAWNDAKLTAALPETVPGFSPVADRGDRLPYSSRFSGNLSIEQQLPLGGGFSGYVRASANYVGERENDFVVSRPDRLTLPSYVQTNILAAVEYNSLTVSAFVNNLADRRGVVSRPTTGLENGYTYIRPRTIGLSVAKAF